MSDSQPKKIVLAYSGGLDTSVILPWLKERYPGVKLVAFAAELGLEPVVEVGDGEQMVPSVRNPITFSATPPRYELPPPGLDEHGAQIRRWLTTDAADTAASDE